MRMSITTTSGSQAGADVDGLAAVGGLAHHRDVVLRVEHRAEARAHDALVVGDDHPDRHRGGS